jgi:hypothetical protein
MSQRWVHVLCWGLPLVVTFFPLITDHFGTFDGEDGWCFISKGDKYPDWTYVFWIIVAFFGWVYLAVFLFLFLVIYVFIKVTRADYPEPRLRVVAYKSLKRLVCYPLIILLCWGSLALYFMLYVAFPNVAALQIPVVLYFSALVIPLLSGTLTSIAFFTFSPEAQFTLVTLLLCLVPEAGEATYVLSDTLQVRSIATLPMNQDPDSDSTSFHFWQTIATHFQSRVFPLASSQGQTPPVLASPEG